jgi:4-hydroxybenzoate polyprenyltransferase
VPVSSLWPQAALLWLATIPCAAYVSLINDAFDRADDAAAGKANRLTGRSPLTIIGLVAAAIVLGLLCAVPWQEDPVLLALYGGTWVAFSLYSLPPLRLKSRGLLGVLADASGAHLFPTLLAVVLAARAADRPLSPPWILTAGVWAFATGVRGILWHQLTDRDNDAAAAVRTFAQRHPPETVVRLGTFLVFPLELAALAALLWQLPSPLPAALLAGYALFVVARRWRTGLRTVVVAPAPHFRIVPNEYYEVLFPLGVLTASALGHPVDWWVLGVHLLLFPLRPLQLLRDAWQVVRA